jgi:hypothetical protein
MSWLDGVLCTPTIGLHFAPDFERTANYRQIMAPLLNTMRDPNSIGQYRDLEPHEGWGMRIDGHDGYTTRFDNQNLIVEFQYRLTPRQESGGLPYIEPTSLQRYTALLEECYKRTVYVGGLILQGGHTMDVRRIGIMAKAALDPNALPPGVQELYDYFAQPWKGKLHRCQTFFLVNLGESQREYAERCHYQMNLNHDEAMPQMHFMLDWQRLFDTPIAVKASRTLQKIIAESLQAAQQHFDHVGEGILDVE